MPLATFYKRLFDGVEPQVVARLEASSIVRKLEPRRYLFAQYSRARGVYILERGIIMIERSSAAGRRQVLAFSYPGDYVGLTRDEFFEFACQSLTEAELREFPNAAFQAAVEESQQLKDNLSQVGGSVFSHALDQVFALGQKNAQERVCYLLLEIQNRGVGPEKNVVELLMTRQDIADYLGLTMETVSRAIRSLRQKGLISIKGNHLVRIEQPDRVFELGSADCQ